MNQEQNSELGHGDTLADVDADNVSFAKALDTLDEVAAIMVTVYDK